MQQSARSFLKRAAKLSGPSLPSAAPRSAPPRALLAASCRASSTDGSFASDYDRIMRASIAPAAPSSATVASSAGDEAPFASLHCAARSIVERTVGGDRYRSVQSPTEFEDYDRHELHHPPCKKTQESVSYFDDANDSCGISGW